MFQKSVIDELQSKLSRVILLYHTDVQSNRVLPRGDADFLEETIARAKEQMRVLKYIDTVTDKVYNHPGAGAVVITDQQAFFVATNTGKFVVDGIFYNGISTKSSVFSAMRGKKSGEEFEWNGRKHFILEIF